MNGFEYTAPKNAPKTSKELLADLQEVSEKLSHKKITQKLYTENGKYNCSTIIRRFGTWNKALEQVGLQISNTVNYSDEELYENILNIWQERGKQPVRRDMDTKNSKISSGAYNRRFSSWTVAIQNFIIFANDSSFEFEKKEHEKFKNFRGSRDPSLRLRYKILKQDNFSCVQCGASPANDPNIILHIDHKIPWSKGGKTTEENMQTLCEKCNLGKSNI